HGSVPLKCWKQGNECSRSRTSLPTPVAFLFTKRISAAIPVNGRAAFRAHRAVVCQFTTGVCNLQHPFGRLFNSVVMPWAGKVEKTCWSPDEYSWSLHSCVRAMNYLYVLPSCITQPAT